MVLQGECCATPSDVRERSTSVMVKFQLQSREEGEVRGKGEGKERWMFSSSNTLW